MTLLALLSTVGGIVWPVAPGSGIIGKTASTAVPAEKRRLNFVYIGMKTFREFMASQEPVAAAPVAASAPAKQKKWKATKEQIVAYWQTLRPDTPLAMKAIPYSHEGSTYGEDGLRITGSPQFIASVLPRLKEFLQYESPTTKLALVYRETESPSKTAVGQSKTSYVFYIQARERGHDQKEIKPEEPKF